MKKIFILPILIAPIMAHATDPVGPAHVNSGAVVATAPAPYATALEETGDTTNVVSASYVKGAYNDAIAAVNKVNADKQGKLHIEGTSGDSAELTGLVIGDESIEGMAYDYVFGSDADRSYILTDTISWNTREALPTVAGVVKGMKMVVDHQRVSAVTTWGNDTATKLPLTNN